MDRLFPFGFPFPTAFYLTLYVLTFALHQAFMHYVLAGSLYVAWATLFPGRASIPRAEQPLAATLRDWMPFLLSAAITAGVAPLLFVQIVYQREFYTANLLLWWRWLLVVPVLIVAFYLLYLLKSSLLSRWPHIARSTVALGTAACFVFVGYSWTANHLLGNAAAHWPDVYATGRLPFDWTTLILRMLVWLGGSFATLSAIAGWQLLYRQKREDDQFDVIETRTLALMSLTGLAVALVAGVAYLMDVDAASRRLVFGGFALPYFVLAIAGLILQITAWSLSHRAGRLDGRWLTTASLGAVFSLLGVSVIREALRIGVVDFASLVPRHAQAATVGGFAVFVISAVLASLLIAWSVWLVRRGVAQSTPR